MLFTGTFELLELLLEHHFKAPESCQVVDRDGNTLYHLICGNKEIKSSVARTALKLLVDHQVRDSF